MSCPDRQTLCHWPKASVIFKFHIRKKSHKLIRTCTHTHIYTHIHTRAHMHAHTSTHAHTYMWEYDESHIRNNHQLMSRSYFGCISAYLLSLHGYDRKKERRKKPPIPLPILTLQEGEAEHEVPALSLKACQGQQGTAGSQTRNGGARSKQIVFLSGTLFCVPVKFVSPGKRPRWQLHTLSTQ